MKKTGKRILSLVLCAVMLVLMYPIPTSALDVGDGTNIIHSVYMEVGANTASVQVTTEGNSILIVALYSEIGQMQGIGTMSITESAVRQNVPVSVSCTRETNMTFKAFMVDSASYAPLCTSVSDYGKNIPDSSYPIVEYGGHRYQLSGYAASFDSAEGICESVGGHLVVVDSLVENGMLADYLRSCDADSAMIGLYDANGSNGTWSTWVTGEPVVFSNWGYNQPDWTGQTICVLTTTDNSYYGWEAEQWDNGWDGDYWFICEWETS